MTHKNILITGGAGFIGSHVVRLFVKKYPQWNIFNLDVLTYAGNLENLRDIESYPNYKFLKGNITDANLINKLFEVYAFDSVIHLAAESHVDRSISTPLDFIYTNIIGTANLLQAAKTTWNNCFDDKLFYQVSTDEVYGSLGDTGLFTEETRYDPRSPYSASKASADHLVRAYHHTYQLPIIISNCSNNYGSHQFPEKLIPLAIHNIKNKKNVPIYGDGKYTRDWLWVNDHATAIETIFNKGKKGETYNIGGINEWKNIDLIHLLCTIMDTKLNRTPGESASLITFVKDRAGHDRRYAIDSSKIKNELGWQPSVTFEQGLEITIDWYLQNDKWLQNITSGEYKLYYETQYVNR